MGEEPCRVVGARPGGEKWHTRTAAGQAGGPCGCWGAGMNQCHPRWAEDPFKSAGIAQDMERVAAGRTREGNMGAPRVAQPAFQPATVPRILIGNLFLALRLTALSGRLRRPRDDWPATMRMPRPALLVFAVALAVAFLPGAAGLVATVVVGALSFGFMIAGLATFHQRSRGKPWRPVALWLVYVVIILFAPVLFVFMVFGLFDTSRGAPISKMPEADNQ